MAGIQLQAAARSTLSAQPPGMFPGGPLAIQAKSDPALAAALATYNSASPAQQQKLSLIHI